VLLPGEPRRAKAIVLPPRERRRAEVINVLPPGNAGGESRGSTATRRTSYGAYDIGRILPPGKYYRREL